MNDICAIYSPKWYQQKLPNYRWWKISLFPTWDGDKNPVNNGINYQPQLVSWPSSWFVDTRSHRNPFKLDANIPYSFGGSSLGIVSLYLGRWYNDPWHHRLLGFFCFFLEGLNCMWHTYLNIVKITVYLFGRFILFLFWSSGNQEKLLLTL